MKRVGIVGLGLMGASLGMALKRRGMADAVWGSARRAETRQLAVERGVVDRAFERPEEAVSGAELAVFCLPVLAIPETVARCRPFLSGDCIVTDVGSTKAQLANAVSSSLRGSGIRFVGSHPIAGSEQTGLAAARADLYAGATTVVTPLADADEVAVRRVCALWEGVGSRVLRMGPEEHDRLIARTSHLPHLVAAMLVQAVVRTAGDELSPMCGSGFRDTTRIAAGSEDVWHDIVKSNRRFVAGELDEFAHVLDRVRAMLARDDFEALKAFLAESREKRGSLELRGERQEDAGGHG